MELNLRNPIVFFDLETTGTNILRDKIVEISYIKVMPSAPKPSVHCVSIREYPFRPKLQPCIISLMKM